jgi:hypothetical protein
MKVTVERGLASCKPCSNGGMGAVATMVSLEGACGDAGRGRGVGKAPKRLCALPDILSGAGE